MSTIHTAIRAACTAQATVETPLGPLLIVRTAKGLAGTWFDGQKHHPGELGAPDAPHDPLLARTADELKRYFAGESNSFDVPLDLLGTPFQRAVWQALLAIPAGHTSTYGTIARDLGAAAAVRAVGGAVGRNPVSVIVPCHRVVGADGSLTGYAGGVERKQAMLTLEARRTSPHHPIGKGSRHSAAQPATRAIANA